MTREIFLKYTLPEEIEQEYDDTCDELVIEDMFDGGEGLEVLPHPTVKTCSCEAYKTIIAEKDAEIERLRMGMDMIMRCAGAPDPAGSLHTVIAIAKKAIAERSDK